jgi:hypothetical protein
LLIRSELGFDVNVVKTPSKSRKDDLREVPKYSILHDHGAAKCVTPVDPAGPHCYRDRTKTC